MFITYNEVNEPSRTDKSFSLHSFEQEKHEKYVLFRVRFFFMEFALDTTSFSSSDECGEREINNNGFRPQGNCFVPRNDGVNVLYRNLESPLHQKQAISNTAKCLEIAFYIRTFCFNTSLVF
jgi:hypothetical protein